MNSKLGKGKKFITKGKWAGMPMFSLTLEERATCPKTCLRWNECYGNTMPFAHRFTAGKELETKIAREVEILSERYTRGFVIRLHILGDFYSFAYASFWAYQLVIHPELHIFGYTAHLSNSLIGKTLYQMNNNSIHNRCWIRFSQNKQYDPNHSNAIFAGDPTMVAGITCPEQTGKTESCLTCGLCWSTTKTINFIDHDAKNKAKRALARRE